MRFFGWSLALITWFRPSLVSLLFVDCWTTSRQNLSYSFNESMPCVLLVLLASSPEDESCKSAEHETEIELSFGGGMMSSAFSSRHHHKRTSVTRTS